jgi:AraC-like DNA-binding protein
VKTETLSVSVVNPVLNHLNNLGINCDAYLNECNIPQTLLDEPDNRLSLIDADNLLNTIAKKTGRYDLGLVAGAHIEARSYNLLQHLFLCSPTLKDALTYMEQYFILFSDETPPKVTRLVDGRTKVSFPPSADLSEQARIRQDYTLSSFCYWLKLLCGREFALSAVDCAMPAPAYASKYIEILKTPVKFNCSISSLYFPSLWMDKTLLHSNSHIRSMIEQEVKQLANKLGGCISQSDRIMQALKQGKIFHNATQNEVASLFHISSRTLNRRLQQESTSLKIILTQARIETAKSLLKEPNISIEQIALNIGFSGRRTLDRIFIKHLGESPAQFRSKQKNTHFERELEPS